MNTQRPQKGAAILRGTIEIGTTLNGKRTELNAFHAKVAEIGHAKSAEVDVDNLQATIEIRTTLNDILYRN